MELAEQIAALRKKHGFSQEELGEKLGVSRQAVSRWEVGSAVPSTDNLKFLGRLYGVSLEYLLHDDAPEPEKNDFTEFTLSNGGTMPRKILRRNKTLLLSEFFGSTCCSGLFCCKFGVSKSIYCNLLSGHVGRNFSVCKNQGTLAF